MKEAPVKFHNVVCHVSFVLYLITIRPHLVNAIAFVPHIRHFMEVFSIVIPVANPIDP